ncbi:MAG TPA: MBL fold metallo-hydrolase [Gammaproteobacteria bacterium]|nr:MBL fold metallo-hydrolase [Gammaproteobacteria bacterium]
MLDLIFLGATHTVTGSKYLLKTKQHQLLIDCGLFQGYKELRLRNWEKLPIEPKSIDAVILTHAHIDHTGYLPLLAKNGFAGPIYSTSGTKDLCSILLPDSGHLQEEATKFANKYGFSKHKPALPLYTAADAQNVLKQFTTVDFNQPRKIFDDCNVSFARAGHILGSSLVKITTQNTSIVFTGDIGRLHDPVMQAPEIIKSTDYLVIESTYGNRLHNTEPPEEKLAKIINQTAKRGGVVLIPAFAVGRAQALLYYISQLKEKNAIPNIPVFLDSPMAIDASELLCRHMDELQLSQSVCDKLCKVATYTNTPEQSKEIDTYRVPMIIISASGMATGGRILHHLKVFAPDERNTILFTGYQAAGTQGARMVNGEREMRIHGQMVPIRAKVEAMTNTSAHADYQEILEWLTHFEKPPKKVFITHGETTAANALKSHIESRFGWTCVVPNYLDRESLLNT